MNVVVTGPLVHRCPHVEELDAGTVEMTFPDEAPELHGLRRYLEGFAETQATHEEVVRMIADAYPQAQIRARFATAGFAVTVVHEPVCDS